MSERISVTRDEYLESLARLSAAATGLSARLNMTQLTWQPGAGERWSVVECLDHIAVSNEIYLNALESAASEASAGRESGVFRTAGFPSTKFVRDLEPPVRTKIPAPRKILPRPTLNPEGILPHYLKTLERISQFARASDVKDLNTVRFPNPFIPLLRFTVGTGFLIVAAHARRHLWQAEQVTLQPDFPR